MDALAAQPENHPRCTSQMHVQSQERVGKACNLRRSRVLIRVHLRRNYDATANQFGMECRIDSIKLLRYSVRTTSDGWLTTRADARGPTARSLRGASRQGWTCRKKLARQKRRQRRTSVVRPLETHGDTSHLSLTEMSSYLRHTETSSHLRRTHPSSHSRHAETPSHPRPKTISCI